MRMSWQRGSASYKRAIMFHVKHFSHFGSMDEREKED